MNVWVSVPESVAYQDFLALWKDADLDIPILKQAKAECPPTFHLRVSTYLDGLRVWTKPLSRRPADVVVAEAMES